jgi:hypothetical protein
MLLHICFWEEVSLLCNNNAAHHKKAKISLQKNIFDHNPFYCIRGQSTLYLLHDCLKRETPRVQRRGVLKNLIQLSDQVLTDQSESLLHLQMYRGSDSTNIQVRWFPCKNFFLFFRKKLIPLSTDLCGAASLLA